MKITWNNLKILQNLISEAVCLQNFFDLTNILEVMDFLKVFHFVQALLLKLGLKLKLKTHI